MLKNKKVVLIAVISLVVLLLVGGSVIFRKSSSTAPKEELIQNEEDIPAVDSSVQVSLDESDKKGDVVVKIKNAPEGTTDAEVELSYNRERQANDETVDETIPDGAFAKCEFKGGSRNCTKDGITLGTCSSGVCRYHKVVGKITLLVLFNGEYGRQKFEKDFEL